MAERESRQLLSAYGIPLVPATVAVTPDEAVAASREIGFPVVLKGIGVSLLHKTEQGLVHLNLATPHAVAEAAASIAAAAGEQLEGYLVQPQIKGQREFVAGLFRDKQFGPVIMFGLGGIYTEALADVAFKLAPLTKADVDEMLGEIKATSLLGSFRGQQGADRK
ncbi:MAG: acetate--CoA ligase family protein, partial [Proteobacteria bacterium]|nr:acetate--CoA ligase family protein [Pseudomonadota bacterium]